MILPMDMSRSTVIRSVLAPLLITSLATPRLYQPLLNYIWIYLRRTPVYNWSTFETIWTVLCYAIIEPSLTIVFLNNPHWRFMTRHQQQNGRDKPRGMRRVSRRWGEIATYILPLLIMDLTMIKKFADVPLADILSSGNHDYYIATSNGTDGVRQPPKTFLVPTLHNFAWSSPLQLHRALPVEAPSSRRLALEMMASFVIYDASFFLFHLGLHTIPLLQRWHVPHHSHDAQINPQVTNQLTVAERLGLIMLANFSLNIIGAHVLTRTLFVPLFVWLLVEIHCGMDIPWGYDKVLPLGWGGGARKHMKHHNTGDGGFEPFFCWMDGLYDRFKATKKANQSLRPAIKRSIC
jgi:cholesterol 25-hydroxylase